MNVSDRFSIGGQQRFALIAGPCVIESEAMILHTAESLKRICEKLNIDLIFKSSYDKANRTSGQSRRGIGMRKGLEVLHKVKELFDLPLLTDVHETWQCNEVAQVVDILQIPAFLCRQTDLLLAAAATGKIVNVKKGQFLAPWDMRQVVEKFELNGYSQLLLCERGTTFGYNNLVVDFTGLQQMRMFGYPVVFDATHSVQQPGGNGSSTGGNRAMIPYLLNAALAVGVDAVFAEVHPNPDEAWSDAPNQLRLDTLESILMHAIRIDAITKERFKQ
ncbi:MAG: 3-deoxy-8-phosphooctulonate synthase [Prevotellaceae bacterium]|nr:3-deoxy-8-phosphooctulonate synthase [Prevotellaceae bacterium]